MDYSKILKDAKVDVIFLFNSMEKPDSNFTYMTKHTNLDGVFELSKNKKMYVSPLEIGNVKSKKNNFEVLELNKEFYDSLNKKFKGKRVGLNYNYLSVNGFNSLKRKLDAKFVDVSGILEEKRKTKSYEEIEKISRACSITDIVFEKIFSEAKECKTEIGLKNLIHDLMREHNVEESFDTIVASGKNSAVPHHISNNTKLKGMTIIDTGVIYENYCSDVSRTLFFGNPKKEEKNNYSKLLSVQKDCIKMVGENSSFSEIQKYSKDKLGKSFIHSIGHGLGIDVHEMPFANENKLKEGNVITIEPGIYFPKKYGIRIEDDVLVLKNGNRVLSKADKEMVIL